MSKNTPTYVRVLIGFCIALFIGGYILFNSRIFIAGPKLTVTTPASGASFDLNLIKVTGNTENTTFISINDRPILIDENGAFNETLLLSPGYNIIMVEAKDKFDRTITERLDLFYKKL